ncbi:tetratricopeptide repeat-containing glycosyltransferase family protein [Caballeronia sordidicola]|uniref:tetratricopeptide repeat-containing glycosyltransferase family protein n=1 Tax=Caballeronia sordidicola TaxID=196367 RepID=UPI00068A96B4|nr:tetratricopeptide repeat-containing glycosyltransferase family protein [Caballeronia sordidicola]
MMLEQDTLQEGLDLIAALSKSNLISQLEEAVTDLRTRFADNANALKSLAFVLNTNDRFAEACSVARQGLTVDPTHPLLHHNAARSLGIRGRTIESRPYSMEAARLLPDNPYMQFHLAGVQLALGEYDEGWKRYRWFYEIPGAAHQRTSPTFPEWNGEPVAGCQFLLVGEQGCGDQIQFLRFANWLVWQGATVDVLVSEPIAGLAASMDSVRAVFTTMPPGPYTYWCHMLRMPEHVKLDLQMLPVAMPYLSATRDKQRHWKTRIDGMSPPARRVKNRRVGIVWAGNSAHPLDRFRSIRLDTLRPLFALTDITWFSVQKGDREYESESLSNEFELHNLGPAIDDFTDTLAILHSLDLLITVDTSVAHLAGAAALPVWTFVAANTEWRWLVDRTDSPWYPSMRLFRQHQLGDWETVIEEVRYALQDGLSMHDAET